MDDGSQGTKEVTYITEAKLVAAVDRWPYSENMEGKFFLAARVVIPSNQHKVKGFAPGSPIHTGFLINVDITKGWFESENTLYVLIAKANEDVYKMTDPG